jgi:hypothetical protein
MSMIRKNIDKEEAIAMKRLLVVGLMLSLCIFTASGAFAADRDAIKGQVDEIVVAINGGKAADQFADAAHKEPYYVFIMKKSGNMLVHPSLTGQSLKEKAEPVYNALLKSTADGVWVDYVWQGKQKHSYVRTTDSGLIVGSGYSE